MSYCVHNSVALIIDLICFYFVVLFYFHREDLYFLTFTIYFNIHLIIVIWQVLVLLLLTFFRIYKFSLSFFSSTRPDKNSDKRKNGNYFKRRVTHICVFCGSNCGSKPEFMEAAKELRRIITERNMHLVYGSGNLGLMRCVSKAM